MRLRFVSRQVAFIYRNLTPQTKGFPAIASSVSNKLVLSHLWGNPSNRSSQPACPVSYRHFHSSACLRSKELYPDNILRSPHPDVHLPEDKTIHELIFETCEKYPDKIALDEYMTGRKFTYREVKDNVIKVANSLHDLGLKKNDVVLSFTNNNVDTTFLMLACSCLGIWFSSANPTYTATEFARHVKHCESKALFVAEDLADMVKDVLEDPELKNQIKHTFVHGEGAGFQPFSTLLENTRKDLPQVSINPVEDVHVLPYSSGTTGLPKGVMLTQYNIVTNILQCLPFSPGEPKSVLGLLPFYHIYGMVVIQYTVLVHGGSLVVLPKFDPMVFLECLQERKIQVAYLVPPLIVFMSKHPMVNDFDLSALEIVYCGAASLGEDLTSEFLDKLGRSIQIQQGYGMTETAPVATYDNEFHPGSVGYMLPNTLGKVIDLETSERLGPEQDGEFCVKGPQVMKGYFKNEEATKDMIDPDGWLHTGDIAYFRENGIVYIKDRLKELIKYKGYQVAPAELEDLLLSHPGVAEVGVVGVPDEKAGELPKAFVVRQEDSEVTEEELVKFVEEHTSETKRLRGGVEFLYDIPKLPSGKILRRALKERSKQKK